MSTFRSKVVEIEAFCLGCEPHPNWFNNENLLVNKADDGRVFVKSKNGWIECFAGDFIIVGNNELYPCPNDVFHEKYDEVY